MENEEAIGYMIMAAKDIGLDKEIIKGLESSMKKCFDLYTAEEAEITYNDFI